MTSAEIRRIGPNNASQGNVIAALHEAINAIEKGNVRPDQALVLLLDRGTDEEPQFRVKFFNAGMRMSEAVALCEAAKLRFFEWMGYVVSNPDNWVAGDD